MKAYVITIADNPESVKIAERCIKSARKFGIEVENFWAMTPDQDPLLVAVREGIPTEPFKERFSRFENCLSAFISHYTLWKRCLEEKVPVLVFEHDAVVKGSIPNVPYKGVLSLGAPSYGKFNTPPFMGVSKLMSKEYLPGAHAYMVKPSAAKKMILAAKSHPAPTDLFICNKNFEFVEEYYPWPVDADDTFSTIQNVQGCNAKHGYQKNKEGYKIL